MRLRRIGIDLDTKNQVALLKTYYMARAIGKVWVHETAKGYHIRIWKRVRPLVALEIRRNLKDDPQRIKFDERRFSAGVSQGFDVLFDHERGIAVNILALPWKMVGRSEELELEEA